MIAVGNLEDSGLVVEGFYMRVHDQKWSIPPCKSDGAATEQGVYSHVTVTIDCKWDG
jgi:hypothetical protein